MAAAVRDKRESSLVHTPNFVLTVEYLSKSDCDDVEVDIVRKV